MAEFHFVTVWRIEAPLEKVWDPLHRFDTWPQWWKGVEEVKVLDWGDANRVGFRSEQVWKSRLPYRLRFGGEITRVEPLRSIALTSHGELEGSGLLRFVADGAITTFQFDWDIASTEAWMNLLAPVARPFFEWNHNVIMDWGAEGLARTIGSKPIATSTVAVL
jgi:uncharacterized membrane protein